MHSFSENGKRVYEKCLTIMLHFRSGPSPYVVAIWNRTHCFVIMFFLDSPMYVSNIHLVILLFVVRADSSEDPIVTVDPATMNVLSPTVPSVPIKSR